MKNLRKIHINVGKLEHRRFKTIEDFLLLKSVQSNTKTPLQTFYSIYSISKSANKYYETCIE